MCVRIGMNWAHCDAPGTQQYYAMTEGSREAASTNLHYQVFAVLVYLFHSVRMRSFLWRGERIQEYVTNAWFASMHRPMGSLYCYKMAWHAQNSCLLCGIGVVCHVGSNPSVS